MFSNKLTKIIKEGNSKILHNHTTTKQNRKCANHKHFQWQNHKNDTKFHKSRIFSVAKPQELQNRKYNSVTAFFATKFSKPRNHKNITLKNHKTPKCSVTKSQKSQNRKMTKFYKITSFSWIQMFVRMRVSHTCLMFRFLYKNLLHLNFQIFHVATEIGHLLFE